MTLNSDNPLDILVPGEKRVLLLPRLEKLFRDLGYPVKLQWNCSDTVEIIPEEGHIDTVFVGSGYDLVDMTDSIVHAVWNVWCDLAEWKKRQEDPDEDDTIPYDDSQIPF